MRLLRLTFYGVGFLVLFLIAATVVDDPDLPQITFGDATFHVQTFGDPANETIVVLHGGPGGDFRSLLALQAFSDQYYVAFYGQPRSELSQRFSQDTLTVATHAADLDAVIADGQGRLVTLIGHSWGAILAAAYMNYTPENIARAVLIEPGFLTQSGAEDWQAQAKRYQNGNDFISLALRAGFEALHVDGPDADAPDDYSYSQMVHFFTDHPDNPYHCQGRDSMPPLALWCCRRQGFACRHQGRIPATC